MIRFIRFRRRRGLPVARLVPVLAAAVALLHGTGPACAEPPPPASLDDTIRSAELIFEGTVQAVEFRNSKASSGKSGIPHTFVTWQIHHVFKGKTQNGAITARFLGDSNVFELGEGVTGTSAGWEGATWAVDPGTVSTHPGVLTNAAIVVRPEDLGIASTAAKAPAGANTVPAVVTDVEYMGSYRTAMLALGASGVKGRARLDAFDSTLSIGDEVVAFWRPERQRIVAA